MNIKEEMMFYKLKRFIRNEFRKLSYTVEDNLLILTQNITFDLKNRNVLFKGFYKYWDFETQNTGICGDLARILYLRIDNQYKELFKIKIYNGQESTFFFTTKNSQFFHIFLTAEKKNGEKWIIDPSFKKFISLRNSGYTLINEVQLVNTKMYPDLKMKMGANGKNFFPLKLFKERVLMLGITFKDEKNYSFELFTKRKKSNFLKEVYKYTKTNGEVEINEFKNNRESIKTPVVKEDIKKISKKLETLLKRPVIIK